MVQPSPSPLRRCWMTRPCHPTTRSRRRLLLSFHHFSCSLNAYGFHLSPLPCVYSIVSDSYVVPIDCMDDSHRTRVETDTPGVCAGSGGEEEPGCCSMMYNQRNVW